MRPIKIIILDVLVTALFLVAYLPIQFIFFLDSQAERLENWFDKMGRNLTSRQSRAAGLCGCLEPVIFKWYKGKRCSKCGLPPPA